jgi:hypothetical protein
MLTLRLAARLHWLPHDQSPLQDDGGGVGFCSEEEREWKAVYFDRRLATTHPLDLC